MATLESAWQEHRTYVLGLAVRTLADPAEAEDVVQEAFHRLASTTIGDIADVRGWLAVVVRRLCLDRLRSAHARREAPTGPLAPELREAIGIAAAVDPADRVTLDDQIQLALAIVLDRLSPAERSAFVLHDVFGFSFDAIAEIVGRTPEACRQLASRARRSINTEAADHEPPDIEVTEHRLVVERFIAACAGGDLAALMAVLDPNAAGDAAFIGGGMIVHVEGAENVAARLVRMMGPGTGWILEPVLFDDDDIALVALSEGKTRAVIRVDISGDRVALLRAFVLPPDASA